MSLYNYSFGVLFIYLGGGGVSFRKSNERIIFSLRNWPVLSVIL
jgi:hypothetical protein